MADAVFNVARSSLLVAALASGNADLLGEATRDRLHQPYRHALFPVGRRLMDAAREAGAVAACTSGAGPSVLALCPDSSCAERVGEAMLEVALGEGVDGQPLPLGLTNRGAHVVDAD
jgi:homoserine kinase